MPQHWRMGESTSNPIRILSSEICTSMHVHGFHLTGLMVLFFFCSRSDIQSSSVTSSAAMHEFRIPRRALLGLHSYCPVHFDAFHAVLVDLTLHIVYLKAGASKLSLKVHRFVKL
jgi:hypothetical protein